MWRGRKIVLIALVISIATIVEGQKKYTDGNRPYEFGFKIDGEQHRQEKKDEEGLIMGEFGFITGDGIYHVTVFATDENGNYKILSMKHIRVGPSPWGPAKQKTPAITTTTTTTTPAPKSVTSHKLEGKPGCSSCLIPTPLPPPGKPKPPGSSGQFPGTPGSVKPGQFPGSGGSPGTPGNFPGSPVSPGSRPGTPAVRPGQFPGSVGTPGGPGFGKFPGSAGNPVAPGSGKFPGPGGSRPVAPGTGGFPRPGSSPGQLPGGPNSPSGQRPGSVGVSPGGPNKVNAGLPPGMTIDDVMGLLYKFNYTVGFHGHNELGYKNGDKDGEYFVNFRDGLSRIVTYVANENGFQPKVKFVRLNSEDTPKAETEKEYGLKGYEFKWFNRR